MPPKNSTRKREPYGSWAVICSMAVVALSLPFGPFEPQLAPMLSGFQRLAMAMFVAGAFVSACAFLVAAISRRDRVWPTLLTCAAAGVLFWLSHQPHLKTAAWDRAFASMEPRLEQGVAFALSGNWGTGSFVYTLPDDLSQISERGEVTISGDDKGRFVAFPQITYGIDNSVGFIWSENGSPPPDLAFPEITRWRQLSPHWYQFWST